MPGEGGVDDSAQEEQSGPLDLQPGVEADARQILCGALDLDGEPGGLDPSVVQFERVHEVRLGARVTGHVLVVHHVLDVGALVDHGRRGDTHVGGQVGAPQVAGQDR